MKRVYLIRHAETPPRPGKPSDGNLVGITSAGRLAARAKAKQLKTLGVSSIVTSPLARARETANILAQAVGVVAVVDERAKEFVAADVGPPDFKTLRDKARLERDWAGERGETFNASIARLILLLDSLTEGTVVVSHELLIQNFLMHLGAQKAEHIDPLTIFALERGESGWRVAQVIPGRSLWQKLWRRLFG